MFKPANVAFLMVLAPLVLYGLYQAIPIPEDFSERIAMEGQIGFLMVFFYSLWLLFVLAYIFIEWTTYYLDVWHITNKRIIDVEQIGIFHRDTKSLRFERIQDITVEVKGIIATFLNFGDVHVQTAGATREIIIYQVRKPYKLKKMITVAIDESSERFYKEHSKRMRESGIPNPPASDGT